LHYLRACRIGVLHFANHTLRHAVRVFAVCECAQKAEVIATELLRFAPRAPSAAPLVWQLGQGIAVKLAMLLQLFSAPSVPNGTKRSLELSTVVNFASALSLARHVASNGKLEAAGVLCSTCTPCSNERYSVQDGIVHLTSGSLLRHYCGYESLRVLSHSIEYTH
jgi:hypothetical protein